MGTLILIPARKGSKGLPGKNVKLLGDCPLVLYSINFAKAVRKVTDRICISTDDEDVIDIARSNGLEVPFIRPAILSDDNATTEDVILHAIKFYQDRGEGFKNILLLQPTSPLRLVSDYLNLLNVYDEDCEMVVSVKLAKDNPYFNLFEEDKGGFLYRSKEGNFTRRQELPNVYVFNGALYLIRTSALINKHIQQFSKIRKIVMPVERSVDIDTQADWILTEYYLKQFIDEKG